MLVGGAFRSAVTPERERKRSELYIIGNDEGFGGSYLIDSRGKKIGGGGNLSNQRKPVSSLVSLRVRLCGKRKNISVRDLGLNST